MAILGLDLSQRSGEGQGVPARPGPKVRRAGLAMLLVGLTAAMLSHMVALPIVLLMLGAELAVGLRRGQGPGRGQDWSVLAATALPLASFLLYRPMLGAHSASLFPAAFVPTLSSIGAFYAESLLRLGTLFGLVLVASMLLLGHRAFRGEAVWNSSPAVTTVLTGLLLAPVALMLYLIHTHASFFPRYGFMEGIALALLLPLGMAWMTQGNRAVALLALVILVAGNIRIAQYAAAGLRPSTWRTPVDGPTDFPEQVEATAGELPVVVVSGLAFVEMNHRENQDFLRRTYFLVDSEAAATYSHATIFNGMAEEKRYFGFSGNVDGYATFVARHPCFLAFGSYSYPEDWVLRKLHADGATLTLIGELPETEYYGTDLWQVQMPGATAAQCSDAGGDRGK
jgi:hypothetical protein